jgi:hypothetical protein
MVFLPPPEGFAISVSLTGLCMWCLKSLQIPREYSSLVLHHYFRQVPVSLASSLACSFCTFRKKCARKEFTPFLGLGDKKERECPLKKPAVLQKHD